MSVAEMAISLYAANEGYLEDIEVNKVLAFERALQDFMKSEHADLIDTINQTGDYSDEIKSGLKTGLEKFKATQSW
jgi:F-type H+-transporting ATPase subunit alpha